jgi:hypothetical protein
MLLYFVGIVFYYIFDAVKNKMIRHGLCRGVKLIRYHNSWHDQHSILAVADLLEWILL